MVSSHELLNELLRNRGVRTVLDPKALKVELLLRHEFGSNMVDAWLGKQVSDPAKAPIEQRPFPHGENCEDCKNLRRCNQCAVPGSNKERCSNGRCAACCRAHCDHEA